MTDVSAPQSQRQSHTAFPFCDPTFRKAVRRPNRHPCKSATRIVAKVYTHCIGCRNVVSRSGRERTPAPCLHEHRGPTASGRIFERFRVLRPHFLRQFAIAGAFERLDHGFGLLGAKKVEVLGHFASTLYTCSRAAKISRQTRSRSVNFGFARSSRSTWRIATWATVIATRPCSNTARCVWRS